jgi:hypothetical protein
MMVGTTLDCRLILGLVWFPTDGSHSACLPSLNEENETGGNDDHADACSQSLVGH